MNVPVMKLRSSASLPSRATRGASGYDLKADLDGDLLLEPGERATVPTGIAMAIPRGYEAQVRPRSGLAAKHGVSVLNSPGTIDADYRGEIGVILINHGSEGFTVCSGDRIAQLVFSEVGELEMVETGSLDGTDRGEGGFGSTGTD